MRKKTKEIKTKEIKTKGVPFFQSIQFKLIITFMVPVLCIVILGASSYMTASNAITKSYESSVEQTMSMMEQYLTLAVDTVQTTYKSYLDDEDIQAYFRGTYTSEVAIKKASTTTLNGCVTTDAKISNIYFIGSKMDSINTANANDEDLYNSFMDTTQGQMANENQMSYLLFGNQSDIDEKLNTNSTKYGARLIRHMKNIGAYMIIDIDYSLIKETLESLDAGRGSYVALITCDETELVSKNGTVTTAGKPIFVGQVFYTNALASEKTSDKQKVTFQGEAYEFIYTKMEDRDAMIAVLIPEETIIAQAADIKQQTMIISVVACILAGLLGTLLSNSISKTIRSIVKKLKRVADGDMTVEIKTKRKDEFRLLTEGISSMIIHMKGLIGSVTEVSEELANAAVQVSGSSTMFMQTAENIQSAISEIETGVTRLDTDSADCLTQMDKLSDKITSVTENATEISQLTITAATCITSGIGSMQELNQSAQSTSRITNHVIGAIETLEEKSRSIGQIVSVMNDISSQTNLLSLNASIEAARAGEAGKGFAVVAEEIRKLADQSLTSASQIGTIIDEMIANTGEVVSIAKEAENVVSSQEEAVRMTTESFEEIDKHVSSLTEALKVISGSVENMDDDRAATLGALESISAVSAESAASSTSVHAAAGKQLDSITQLEQASAHLKIRSDQLTEILQQFTL